VLLVALVFVAVAAFFATRAVAMNNRELSARNAEEWYHQGTRLVSEGRLDEAIDAFRRATVHNRTNRAYQMALAQALRKKGDYDSARSILLVIRASAPEDAEINLDLARLAAARQDVTEALKFFHDALYAPWPPEQAENRRAVRLELIRFLLAHDQAGRAQAELLAASADTPDDVAHQIQLGELFEQAGDSRNALGRFQRALRLDPQNDAVLAGAGKAAFALGDYALARRYFHQVPDEMEAVRRLRTIADEILSRDPMAPRIGAGERRRRLDADLTYVHDRLAQCAGQGGGVQSPQVETLQNDLRVFSRRWQRMRTFDQDTIESGVDLIERAARLATTSCGSPTPVDEALLLIARQHGGAAQ
jgi:tetratricopeptide (TPR) repeat protein